MRPDVVTVRVMFIYSRILNGGEKGKGRGKGEGGCCLRDNVFRSSASGFMFHYTVLNLFIHRFSIQNPFSHNFNAPTELESSAGRESRKEG